jgi:CheY-like chemotaxis protein
MTPGKPRSGEIPALKTEAYDAAKSPPVGSSPGARAGEEPSSGDRLVRKGRLLIVDDEPQIGNTLRLLLDPDHEVIPVTSGREALERLKTDVAFDIIFCDLMMPEISGMDFYKALSQVAPQLVDRLVFMTGGVFSPKTNQFLDTISNTCIEKPFDISALLALISARVR